MADDWHYAPMVEAGSGAIIQWNLTTTAERCFVRLVYTDDYFEGDVGDWDFDGDGLTNAQEVDPATATNPLNQDSDGDGTPDGVEIANGSDPNDPLSDSYPPIIEVIFQNKSVGNIWSKTVSEDGQGGTSTVSTGILSWHDHTGNTGGDSYEIYEQRWSGKLGELLYPSTMVPENVTIFGGSLFTTPLFASTYSNHVHTHYTEFTSDYHNVSVIQRRYALRASKPLVRPFSVTYARQLRVIPVPFEPGNSVSYTTLSPVTLTINAGATKSQHIDITAGDVVEHQDRTHLLIPARLAVGYGTTGDYVPSIKTDGARHWVMPKESTPGDTSDDAFSISAEVPGEVTDDRFSEIFSWGGGGNAVEGNPKTRVFSRTSPAHYTITLNSGGSVIDTLHVWVVWIDLTATMTGADFHPNNELEMSSDRVTSAQLGIHQVAKYSPVTQVYDLYFLNAIEWRGEIKPLQITRREQDIPKLNWLLPLNSNFQTEDERVFRSAWDMTRDVKNRFVVDSIERRNDIEFINDDVANWDKDSNPYDSIGGDIFSYDAPGIDVNWQVYFNGEPNPNTENLSGAMRAELYQYLIEWARVRIGPFWHQASDMKPWHVRTTIIRPDNDPRNWVRSNIQNENVMGEGHPNW